MTLGSLFDGLGGWQLAAIRNGITPLWSSEIDNFCCAVTHRHFPNTIQLGDINDIDCPPYVDIITAGSPCQDLSIAGKRSGIHAERSGLFFKAVELVRRVRPQFFIWENVTGAFSSNGGADFKTVIETILGKHIPSPKRWLNAGVVDSPDVLICWRVLDAQYFGTPQRRRRIFLVADFAGRRAAKILFEPASMSGDIAKSEGSQQKPATGIGINSNFAVYENHWKDSRIKRLGDIAPTVSAMYGTGGNNIPLVAYGLKLNATCDFARELEPTLRTVPFACVATSSGVRRLTPVECERLQGLPDNYSAGGSDTQRYKALGNGMAQPCADWVLKGVMTCGE